MSTPQPWTTDWYKARLFEAWEGLRGQTKGLQRQRRLIRRLQAENAALRSQLQGTPVCARCKSPDHHVSDCEFGA